MSAPSCPNCLPGEPCAAHGGATVGHGDRCSCQLCFARVEWLLDAERPVPRPAGVSEAEFIARAERERDRQAVEVFARMREVANGNH